MVRSPSLADLQQTQYPDLLSRPPTLVRRQPSRDGLRGCPDRVNTIIDGGAVMQLRLECCYDERFFILFLVSRCVRYRSASVGNNSSTDNGTNPGDQECELT